MITRTFGNCPANLSLLQVVDFRNSMVKRIEADAFAYLPKLKRIYISDHPDWELVMSRNPLVIEGYAFRTNYTSSQPLEVNLTGKWNIDYLWTFARPTAFAGAQRPLHLHLGFSNQSSIQLPPFFLLQRALQPLFDDNCRRLPLSSPAPNKPVQNYTSSCLEGRTDHFTSHFASAHINFTDKNQLFVDNFHENAPCVYETCTLAEVCAWPLAYFQLVRHCWCPMEATRQLAELPQAIKSGVQARSTDWWINYLNTHFGSFDFWMLRMFLNCTPQQEVLASRVQKITARGRYWPAFVTPNEF